MLPGEKLSILRLEGEDFALLESRKHMSFIRRKKDMPEIRCDEVRFHQDAASEKAFMERYKALTVTANLIPRGKYCRGIIGTDSLLVRMWPPLTLIDRMFFFNPADHMMQLSGDSEVLDLGRMACSGCLTNILAWQLR